MRFRGVTQAVEVLAGLAALGLILATIFGAHAILAAVGSTVIAVVAGYAAHRSKTNALLHAEQRQRRERLERETQQQLERKKEQTLDRDCATLLQRARVAVNAILVSDACTANLISPPIDKTLLTDNINSILDAGREITDLRADINAIIVASSSEKTARGIELAGPMTSAVIRPQRQHIASALEHAASRVQNLESYVTSVQAVDVTYRDWLGAQRAELLNDRVRDLYARTAADRIAAEELSRLAERTAEAERAFRVSVSEASLAAEVLALPDGDK